LGFLSCFSAAWNYGIANANACGFLFRHAFARSYTAVIDLNAVLLVVDTLKISQRNGPLAGGVENFPVKTSVLQLSVVWLIVELAERRGTYVPYQRCAVPMFFGTINRPCS